MWIETTSILTHPKPNEMNYNKRKWLNRPESYSSSNIVTFDGKVNWGGEIVRSTFLQISNCDRTVKFYKTDNDSMSDFINKLELIDIEVQAFIKHLTHHKTK